MAKKAKKKVTKKVVNPKPGFKFTGDPVNGQDPESIRFFGYLFKLNGNKVSVSDEVAAKLRVNSHFTEV